MTDNFDPKLRVVIKEIENTLRKHDIGGFVALDSGTHGEFKFFIETPSWSNARFIQDGKAMHIKLHAKSDHKKTEMTVGMLMNIRDMAAVAFKGADSIIEQIKNHIEIDHEPLKGLNNDDR